MQRTNRSAHRGHPQQFDHQKSATLLEQENSKVGGWGSGIGACLVNKIHVSGFKSFQTSEFTASPFKKLGMSTATQTATVNLHIIFGLSCYNRAIFACLE